MRARVHGTSMILLSLLLSINLGGASRLEDITAETSYFEYIELSPPQGRGVKLQTEHLKGETVSFSFEAFQSVFHVKGSRTTEMFHPDYKTVHMDGTGAVVKESPGVPDCFYQGTAVVHDNEHIGQAYFSTCSGMVMGVLEHKMGTFEIHNVNEGAADRKEARHIIFDLKHHNPKQELTCGNHENLEVDQDGKFRLKKAGYHRNLKDPQKKLGKDAQHDHHHHHHHHVENSSHDHYHHDQQEQVHNSRLKILSKVTSQIHPLDTGECDSSATNRKFVDILVVNDFKRVSIRGDDTEQHSAAVFNIVYLAYVGGVYGGQTYSGLRENGVFNCYVTPRLIGQLSFRNANPSDLTYTTTNCETQCCSGGSACDNPCAAGEVGAICLLTSFRSFSYSNRATLASVFNNPIDNYALFTDENLSGSTAGIAYTWGMCNNQLSMNLNMVGGGSVIHVGTTVAHELGHNFGMSHDYQGSPTIMSPGGNEATVRTQFSVVSKQDINIFLTAGTNDATYTNGSTRATYRSTGNSCLENDSGASKWNAAPICGDGIIDDSEQCDVGFGNTDSCCDMSTCTLNAGCQCAITEACCDQSGQFLPSTTNCRSSVHSDCDVDEFCTGSSGQCPMDLFSATGTTCNDLTSTSISAAGMCYEGHCVSPADNCVSPPQAGYIYPRNLNNGYADCSLIHCTTAASGGYSTFFPALAVTGTPCGSGKQCQSQYDAGGTPACVDSSQLRVYRWYRVCPFDAICRDESGGTVSNSLCEGSPPTCPNTPTVDPTPFPTNLPTNFPSSYPTPVPSIPIREPTTPGGTYSPSSSPVVFTSTAPTQAPTIEQFRVSILFSTLTLAQVTPTLQTTYRSTLSSLLGVADDSFTVTYVAASVRMSIEFLHMSQGQSPQATASALSNYSPAQLSGFFGTTVSTVSVPESLNPSAPSPTVGSGGGGGGGDSGEDNGGSIAGIVVGVLVVLAVACALYYCCCRQGKGGVPRGGNRRQNSFMVNHGTRSHHTQQQQTMRQKQQPAVIAQAVALEPTTTHNGQAATLPPGWRLEYTNEGVPFYFHQSSGTSQWHKPTIQPSVGI